MSAVTDLKWVRTLDSLLYVLDEKPQFGGPSFPLRELESHLSHIFGRDFHLKISEEGFIAKEELLKGIGQTPQILEVFFTSNPHPLYFATSEQDLKELSVELLQAAEGSFFVQDPYYQGVTQFFALEILSKINSLEFGQGLEARLGSFLKEVPPNAYFAINVSLETRGRSFWGRLLISDQFRSLWKNHFYSSRKKEISRERAQKIPLEVALIGGKSQLSQKEWQKAKEGDVVLLDYSSLDVGKVVLTLNGESLFRGKLLDDGIKLLEYPLYEEVTRTMDEEADENLYGDLEEDEESLLDEEEEEIAQESPKEKSFEKIPIQLTIEVGRVGMTLDDLMNLAPGNVIDIKVEPERGVDLVVNGKKVGRGELVKLGQVLGVRILEL